MARLTAQPAASHNFDERALQLPLAEVARRLNGKGAMSNQVLETRTETQILPKPSIY